MGDIGRYNELMGIKSPCDFSPIGYQLTKFHRNQQGNLRFDAKTMRL